MNDLETYHTWNIAAVRFSCTPEALTAEQAARLAREVEQALSLEARILESREAAAVTVPADHVSDAAREWRAQNPGCPILDLTLTEALHRELHVQATLDVVAASVSEVNDDAAHAYYDANPARFHQPDRRVVRHILITVNPEFAENTEDVARSRVDALVDVLEDGADFAELAAQHSECPTAMQGGQVGTVAKGVLYPEVEDAVFAVDAGQWAGPVRTELGWHLVFCESIVPAQTVSFDTAKPKILEFLNAQACRSAQAQWVQGLPQYLEA